MTTTTTTTTTTSLETCLVPPPAGGPASVSVPLSFLDILWLFFQHPIRRLFFYRHPISEAHFLQTLVPNLKNSLSLTLRHFLPLSGHLLYPKKTDEEKPLFRYVAGDSVPLTVAISGEDFEDLIGNHPRDADRFYDFVPEMPPVQEEEDYKLFPLLALKVTLFPGRGICIGVANSHVAGDASSIFRFMKTWSTISADVDSECSSYLPVFDRSFIKDTIGIDSIFWEALRKFPVEPSSFPLPTNRVRATFTLTRTHIEMLKDLVRAKKPDLARPSSFVVSMSYIWTCLVKSGVEVGEKPDKDVPEFFIFTVDARARVDPPVPENYFGNCLGYAMAKIEHERLTGEEGFVTAVEAISEDIKNRVNKKNEILRGAENWMSNFGNFGEMRFMGVSGSPRFDLYGVDFGWGSASKVEVASIDGECYSVSLCRSCGSDGGLEVGLSLSKERMEAFGAIFDNGPRV
ncbi:Coumaroyl-CoA\\x3aanthocyanidin 3-O-glucoside-6-O-coumaroyltransferase 2 [Striga hermonthica]|uniref:Coumaroyl-CoA\x3aanthocyanidin 3-O-glucoside-6-O-coumaroyltransferase 2 n=1 Tax=Striga hermonthica TaxID=68872 RepID=A0A9N7MNX5_STRHE|nr:Coumaroyl-CoA\\x3aanthocyanidin 3-O-glucoside-6-O-coumaroyltransferase 2 [Striga hermonthica]